MPATLLEQSTSVMGQSNSSASKPDSSNSSIMKVQKDEEIFTSLYPKFKQVFKTEANPTAVSCAPGRIEIVGNHTDYNEGFVLSAAVDLCCYIVAGKVPKEGGKKGEPNCSLFSTSFENDGVSSFPLKIIDSNDLSYEANSQKLTEQKTQNPKWCKYIAGTIFEFQRQFASARQEFSSKESDYDLALLVHSTVPLGGAVSSSAALEVAVFKVLRKVFEGAFDTNIGELEEILACKSAENNFVGMGCGILDQFSSSQGKEGSVIVLDCRYPIEKLEYVENANLSFVLANTHKAHELVDGQYEDLKQNCFAARDFFKVAALRDLSLKEFESRGFELPLNTYRRAKHIMFENERVNEGILF